MPAVTTTPGPVLSSPGLRRTPTQARSRERVERILDASSALIAERGVEALSTRGIAAAAEVPIASLYQYFSDRDAILLALVERDTQEMDEQVALDLAAVEDLSIVSLVETTMRAYVKVYARRPDFVEIWLRGRTNAAINEFGRQHNRRTAAELRDFAIQAGLARADLPAAAAELAVEIGDRCFQLAYEADLGGDDYLIEQGIAMVSAYLRRFSDDGATDD